MVEMLRMTQYANAPTGVPGNDDMGVLSAWYVFASLGIYPMIPGIGGFTVNTPAFPKAVLHRKDGDITLLRKGAGRYITGLKVNGEEVGTSWISWDPLSEGGTIEFKTSSKPASWGTAVLPPSYH
jgi:putative alpha-1,2-mannosidase